MSMYDYCVYCGSPNAVAPDPFSKGYLCEKCFFDLYKCEECDQEGVGYNDDGVFMCEDCLLWWAEDEYGAGC